MVWRLWQFRGVSLSLATLAGVGGVGAMPNALAQPEPGAMLAPSEAREPDSEVVLALESLRAAYALRAITERQAVTLRPLQGSPRTSRLSLLVDRGDGSLIHPPRVVLKLGVQLQVEAIGDQLRAINLQNKLLIFETVLSGPASPETLGKVIPSLPLPQLGWALAPDSGAAGTLRIDPLGEVTFLRADRRGAEQETVLQGTSRLGPVELVIDSVSGRLLRLMAALGSDGTRLEIRTEAAEPPDAPGWGIDPAGRTVVKAISALRATPTDAQVGARAPGLGLMTPSLTAWDLAGSLREMLASPTQVGSGSTYIALVLFRASGPEQGAGDVALKAALGLGAVKKELDHRRQQGQRSLARLMVRPVAVLELADVQPARIRDLEALWKGLGEDLLWTSGGHALLDRFAPEASVVVALIDGEQTLQGVLLVDAANTGADAVATQFRAMMKDLSLPEEAPEGGEGAPGPK